MAYQRLVCISVFYAPEEWHRLISVAIRPFVEKNPSLFFRLAMSRERGDHLRIVFDASKDFDTLVMELNDRLNDFLQTHPSKAPASMETPQVFFMNFPPNSICFGLFRYVRQSFTIRNDVRLDDYLSQFSRMLAMADHEALPLSVDNRFILGLTLLVTTMNSFFAEQENTLETLHLALSNSLESVKLSDVTEILEHEYVNVETDILALIEQTLDTLSNHDRSMLHACKEVFDSIAGNIEQYSLREKIAVVSLLIQKIIQDLDITNNIALLYFLWRGYTTSRRVLRATNAV